MDVLAWILGIFLAAVFVVAGLTKVLDFDRMRDHFGYSKRQYQLIGVSEVAAAAGVIIGLVWKKLEWLGGAAAVGIGTLMMGALITHARVDDEAKKVVPALVLLIASIVFIIALSLR